MRPRASVVHLDAGAHFAGQATDGRFARGRRRTDYRSGELWPTGRESRLPGSKQRTKLETAVSVRTRRPENNDLQQAGIGKSRARIPTDERGLEPDLSKIPRLRLALPARAIAVGPWQRRDTSAALHNSFQFSVVSHQS